MLEILVKAVFWVLNFIASLVLAPITNILSILVGQNITDTIGLGILNLFEFINIIGNYFVVAIDLLCIPRSLFTLVLVVIGSIITYVIFARVYFFAMAIYNHFKP